MAESASYAACRQQAAPQRHHRARAREHVVVSKFRGGGATDRRQTRYWPEDVPGQAVKVESRRLGQASGRDSNLSRAGPGAVGPAQPGCAQIAGLRSTGKNSLGLKYQNCYNVKISRNVTFFGFYRRRTELSRIVIFCHAQMSRIVIFWVR